jgi:hypothetical protein
MSNLVAVGNEEVWKTKVLQFVSEVVENPSNTIILVSGTTTNADVPKCILEKYPQLKILAILEQNGILNSFPKKLMNNKFMPFPPRPIKSAEEWKKHLQDNNVLILPGMNYCTFVDLRRQDFIAGLC